MARIIKITEIDQHVKRKYEKLITAAVAETYKSYLHRAEWLDNTPNHQTPESFDNTMIVETPLQVIISAHVWGCNERQTFSVTAPTICRPCDC